MVKFMLSLIIEVSQSVRDAPTKMQPQFGYFHKGGGGSQLIQKFLGIFYSDF